MARQYRSGPRRTSYSGGGSDGYERARQHIEDSKRLTRELGGTDVDVKNYFYSLSDHQLDSILTEYGEQFGSKPEVYAREVMPNWKSGRVQMSGTVAERLFKLLPPRMPLQQKYKLTETLWTHFGPRSKKRLRIGLTTDVNTAVTAIDEYIYQVVTSHQIPQEMEARFNWLSHGDVGVKQQLLNHLRSLERQIVSDGVRLQLPVMIDHLKSREGDLTHRMAQTLTVGNHKLELLIDREFEGVALEEWKPPPVASSKSKPKGYGWLIWVVIIGVIIFLARRSH